MSNWNGKIKCLDNCNNESIYTTNKVYDVINGRFKEDSGGNSGIFLSFEDFNKFSNSKWEEVKEDGKVDVEKEYKVSEFEVGVEYIGIGNSSKYKIDDDGFLYVSYSYSDEYSPYRSSDISFNLINQMLFKKYEEQIDWSKVKVDTRVLVKDFNEDGWAKRYFAKYEGGRVYAWEDGTTSWSQHSTMPWKFAKLYEEK